MNEEDTYNRLKRVPFEQVWNAARDIPSAKCRPSDYKGMEGLYAQDLANKPIWEEHLANTGWTYNEFMDEVSRRAFVGQTTPQPDESKE